MSTEQQQSPSFLDGTTVGRLVVRARRIADLSQRGLAAQVGLSPSTVSRIESGRLMPTVGLMHDILAVAGLRMLVVDVTTGRTVAPTPARAVRDNAGRRFPAHLDVAPPDEMPLRRALWPRHDRPVAQGWYHLREERDRRVRAAPGAARPADHPTVDELDQRRRLMRGRQPRVDPAPRVEPPCECPDACFEETCVPECPCQCEAMSDRWRVLARRPVPPDEATTQPPSTPPRDTMPR